jgi:UDP-glucose 4-epimerase
MKGNRVVITGGAGFIGSNLSHELASDNTVIIIDDLYTGKVDNIASLINKENVKFIQGSILDLQLLQEAFRAIDFVFHQAAIPSVPRSVKDPLSTNTVNITGTLNVLLASRDNKVKKVVYASSSSVYGDTPILPKNENMVPNPLSPYALTKLVGEYYCRIFTQVYGLPTICLRYFNVYGPRQDPNAEYAAVIPKFISRILQNKCPIVYGDGNQTRDFTYIKDVVNANILAAESQSTGVINIGSGSNVTINELAETIIKSLNRDIGIIHEQNRVGEVKHSQADITLAKTIGYKPKYSLVDGLLETVRRFFDA